MHLLAIFVEGPVGLRCALRGAARGRRRVGSLSRGDGARTAVFLQPCLGVWGVGGAARGAFLTRRTLGSFLMRRGGIVINGLLFVLRRPHKRRSPSRIAKPPGFMFFGRQILFRVRVWTSGSKATTFCEQC